MLHCVVSGVILFGFLSNSALGAEDKGNLDVSVPAYGVTTNLGYRIFNDELHFLYGPSGPPSPGALSPGQQPQPRMVDGRLVTSIRSMDWTYLKKIP